MRGVVGTEEEVEQDGRGGGEPQCAQGGSGGGRVGHPLEGGGQGEARVLSAEAEVDQSRPRARKETNSAAKAPAKA